MKYSVIIPTYTKLESHVSVLADAVASIQGVMPKDSELIVVDDGSPVVNIVDVVHEYGVDIFVRRKKNLGIATSWNDGIKVAKGEYVAIVNDDITVEEGWLDKLRVALEDDDANWVSAPGVAGKQNGIGIEENYQWFPGYCFMMRKSTLNDLGGFDEQFSPFNYEDTDMWTRVLEAEGKLVRNYSTTITHREGHVLHTLDYEGVSAINKEKFIKKHGFDPVPVFYYNQPYDFKRK